MILKLNPKMRLESSCMLVALACLVLTAVEAQRAPRVSTPYGEVIGFDHTTDSGKKAEIFLGVPFAKPPVGELRQEKPLPPAKWTTPLNATTVPKACAVTNALFGAFSSEDCLYLNIFKPKAKSKNPKGYPIMVWIHGGSFLMGSMEQYGYQRITDNFTPLGIVVVFIQYRVGPWGFFASGDDRIPGNLGLWDQVEALRMTRAIAASFDADPSRITVAGHSAGGGSVSWLSVSEHSAGLFSQVIELSGSANAMWVRSDDVVETSRKLAQQLGCDFRSPTLKQCLKNKTQENVQDVARDIAIFREDINFAYFNPHFDGKFVQSMGFAEAVRKAPKKPTLISVAHLEGVFWSLDQIGVLMPGKIFNLPEEIATAFTKKDLASWIRQNVATKARYGNRSRDAANDIISHYADCDAPRHPTSRFYFTRLTEMLSDIMFAVPAVREVRQKAAAGMPVYFSVYSYQKDKSITEYPIDATPHGAELDPLFNNFIYAGFENTDDDRTMRTNFVTFLATFIKNGTPVLPGRRRARPATPQVMPYIDMNTKVSQKRNIYANNVAFWDRMAAKYKYDLVSGSPIRVSAKKPAPSSPLRRSRLFRLRRTRQ